MTRVSDAEPEDNGANDDVRISLPSIYRERAIRTGPESDPFADHECGVGLVVRADWDDRRGRDIQARCKQRDCHVCGPKGRETKRQSILKNFEGSDMHAVVVQDGSTEWATLHKALKRNKNLYHRVPLPEGLAVIVTTAKVGALVPTPEPFVQAVVATQPCSATETRRMTSSRPWKGAGDTSNHRWKRVGISRLPVGKRVQVYKEEGCEPRQVPDEHVAPDVLVVHDIRLPEPDSPEMKRLADRLELVRDEPPPEGLSDWERVVW